MDKGTTRGDQSFRIIDTLFEAKYRIMHKEEVYGGNQLSVETGENHEIIMFKSSEKFSKKCITFGR